MVCELLYDAEQGPRHLVVGATKRYGLSAAEALAECGRGARDDPASFGAASTELQRRAARVWPPADR